MTGSSHGERRGDSQQQPPAVMPSDVTASPSFFDKAATWSDRLVSRAGFFVFCLLIVVIWLPSFFLIGNIDTWQLIINTVTTIVVFLLMALLQNTQKRADDATQHKLNAVADGLADLMEKLAEQYPDLESDSSELRNAVGLEDREAS